VTAVNVETEERPVLALVEEKDGTKVRPYGDGYTATPQAERGKILFIARRSRDLCKRLGKGAVAAAAGVGGDHEDPSNQEVPAGN
jgi:hypothetical protein